MSATATKRRVPNNEGKQSVDVRDTRAPIRPRLVEDLIVKAGAAVAEETAKERFSPMPQVWGSLRQTMHTLSEKDRYLCTLQLLREMAQRIEHDRASSFHA